MTKNTALRAGLAIIIFVLGNLQAWDSDVPVAGLLVVSLVSLATALPPVALLVPLQQSHFLGSVALSFILLLLARLISPISLPGLFIVLVPAVMGIIFTGIFRQSVEDEASR
ncbi:MAG TPA: hypothetical protein VK880_05755 [Anaerolineales bacterium]|nr:hypothetical protein [Anaerolineales bacterium]